MEKSYSSLQKAGLIFTCDLFGKEETFILFEKRKDGSSQVDLHTFESLFGDVKNNPTYEALSSSHTFKLDGEQYTMTAEEIGYQKYFDQWKEQGIFDF